MKDMERELKILVSKEQFNALMNIVNPQDCRKQINTYYDTIHQDLKRQGMALRIRQIENTNILTIKKPLDSITKYEYEREIHTPCLNDTNSEEREWINEHLGFNSEGLQPFVATATLRCIKVTGHAEICFDQTDFAHHTDYEIEYEYTDDHDGTAEFQKLLNHIGLKYEKNCPSKLARAVLDQFNENL